MRWVLVPLAALALAGCGDRTPKPKVQTAVMGAPAAPEVESTRIVAQIRQALSADPELGAYVIDVDSKEGLVVISGVAPSEAAKERATDIARHTPHVQDVSNQLEVRQG